MIKKIYDRIKNEEPLCEVIRRSLGRQSLPESIKRRAESEKRGYFILPGTRDKPYFVGNPPRWKENPVGDEEYVWVLNRHGNWKDYILYYCETGSIDYLERMKFELLDWIENCPRPAIDDDAQKIEDAFNKPDIGLPWRALETGIRMYDSWNYAVTVLIQEKLMTVEELDKVVGSVRQHAEVLNDISPMIWPEANHNHYIMENLGLIQAASLLRELPEAPRWAIHASEELARCVKNQITSDGGQIEGCPSYHALCMNLFFKWVKIAGELRIEIPAESRKKMYKGMDYAICATRPTGVDVPWGDSDPVESAVLSAALSYLALGEEKWLSMLIHLLGFEEVQDICRINILDTYGIDWDILDRTSCKEIGKVNWQKELSQVMFRSDWSREALSVFFGCKIPCFNGHAHIHPSSFDFCAYGKALVTDPGRYTYRECEERRIFKSSAMHNTLMLDGKEPYEYATRWTFRNEKDGCILNVEENKDIIWAEAMHTSYFPTVHVRLLALIDDRFLLVWDRLEHYRGQRVDIYYHLDSTCVKMRENLTLTEDDVSMVIRTSDNLAGTLMAGKISERIDHERPSTRVCYTGFGSGEGADFVTAIIPFRGKMPEVSSLIVRNGQMAEVTVDRKHYFITWDKNQCGVVIK